MLIFIIIMNDKQKIVTKSGKREFEPNCFETKKIRVRKTMALQFTIVSIKLQSNRHLFICHISHCIHVTYSPKFFFALITNKIITFVVCINCSHSSIEIAYP